MAPENHSLLNEFPEHREKIHAMKLASSHFARLFDEYNDVDRDVRRLEGESVPVADESFEELKKQRLNLKDQLYSMLIQ
jgi:uncharacterized protein YdcH (DUF465 family)